MNINNRANAATLILALLVLYFGGAAWIWNVEGLVIAVLVAAGVICLMAVWQVIYTLLEEWYGDEQ